MLTALPERDFSLDMQSMQRLQRTARDQPDQALETGAREFEALFLHKMLEVMRSAMPESGLMQSNQMQLTQSLMDRQWAQTLSERGMGLADMMTRQLRGSDNAAAADRPDTIAGIARATPRALGASETLDDARPRRGPLVDMDGGNSLFASQAFVKGAPLIELAPRAAVSAADVTDARPEHVRDFVARMGDAAEVASRRSGVPQRLILAQAALETGWGRFEVMRADGQPSHNVFNIKATGWQGDVAHAQTREYVDGQIHSERAGFRAYDSYTDSFSDYARLLSESPRYAEVARANDPAAAAQMLQDAGYATDPRYADKLVAIMDSLPAPVAKGATPLIDMNGSAPLFAAQPG